MTGKQAGSAGQTPDSADGLTIPEICAQLGISERTARRYLSNGNLTKVPGSKPVRATLESVEHHRSRQADCRQVPDSAGQVPDSATSRDDLVEALRQQVADLQRRLDESEEERRRITDQKDRALWAAVEASRMIEAPTQPRPEPEPEKPEPDEPVTEPPPTRKQKFWTKLFHGSARR